MKKLITGMALAVLLAMGGTGHAADEFVKKDSNRQSVQSGVTGAGETRMQRMTNDGRAKVEAASDTTTAAVFASMDGTLDQIDWRLNTGTGHLKDISEELTAQSLQLGVIEGNGTTGTAALVSIDGKMVDGTDIGDVTINNATGAAGVFVQGQSADNAPLAGNPLAMAIVDGTGDSQNLLGAASGMIALVGKSTGVDNWTNSKMGHMATDSAEEAALAVLPHVYDGSAWDMLRGNSVGGMYVQGSAADGATATGNPEQIGGVDMSGNVQALSVSTDGVMDVGQHGHDLDTMEAITGWATVQDAANIATSTTHIEGTLALEWDKTGGSNVLTALEKTITTVEAETEEAYRVSYSFYLAALTDVDYAVLRLGEDDSNYLEWQTAVADLVVGWNHLEYAITSPDSQTGAGLSTSNFKYALVGMATDDAADTVNDLTVDNLRIDLTLKQAPAVSAIGDVEIGTVVLKDWNSNDRLDIDLDGAKRAAYVQSGSLAAESGGNLDDIATDTGTIDADTSTIAGAVAAGQMQVDIVAEIPAGTQLIGIAKIGDGGNTADVSSDGALIIGGSDAASADGQSNTNMIRLYGDGGAEGPLQVANLVFNGTNWDRQRGDTSGLDISDISAGTQTNDVKVTMDTEVVATTNAIVDGWDATSGAGISTDGPQVMVNYDSTKPTAVADGQAVAALGDQYGRLLSGVEPEHNQVTITSADATGATQVIGKTASKKIYILSLLVSTDTAMNIQFQDDTGPTVLIEQLYFAANGGVPINFPPEAPLVVNTNEDFDVIASVAGNISVTATYYLAP